MAAPNDDHAEVQVEDPNDEAPEIPVGTILLEVSSILTSFELGEVNLGPAFPPRAGYGTRGTPVSLYAIRKPRKKKKNKNKVIAEDAPPKEPETKPPPPDGDGAGAAGGVTVF
jgi:hypothetical protein